MRCRILVSAVGALHKPVIPGIPGTATFAGIEGWVVPSSCPHPGPSWHTAQWEHTVPLQVTRPWTPPSNPPGEESGHHRVGRLCCAGGARHSWTGAL